jgi:hypothetical protein
MVNFKLEVILNSIKAFLSSKWFYKTTYENLISYTLTPIGFTFFILGLMLKVERRRDLLFHLWILSVAIFFLIMPGQSWQGYYQMHLLPAACVIIAKVIYQFSESQFYRDSFLKKRITGTLFSLLALLVVFRYSYGYYKVPPNFQYVVETGKAIDQLTEKDALVIASIENGPDLVYYANRKGWPFMVHLEEKKKYDIASGEDITGRIYDPILYLENLRKAGAKYFASASLEEFLSYERFSKYMYEHYRIVKQTPHFIIFDIKEKIGNAEP